MIEPVKIINQRMLAYFDFKCLSQTTINDGNGNLRITIECFQNTLSTMKRINYPSY